MRILIGIVFIMGLVLLRVAMWLYCVPLKGARWLDKKIDQVFDNWA